MIPPPLPLIGLTGQKRSGKDTTAQILRSLFGSRRYAFADAIRREVYDTVGHTLFPDYPTFLRYLDAHKGDDPASGTGWIRPLLQGWGIMKRDRCGPDYWIAQVPLMSGVVISDVRMPNEEQAIHDAGGVVWRITRPGSVSDGNATEAHVASLVVDAEISNDGTPEALGARIYQLAIALWKRHHNQT